MKAMKYAPRWICTLVLVLGAITIGWTSPAVATDYTITVTSVASAPEGVATDVVRVELNQQVAGGDVVSIDWALQNGTASAADDLTVSFGTLTFNLGQQVHYVSLTPKTDSLVEGNETINVVFSNPRYDNGGGSLTFVDPGLLPITITDVDKAILSIESKSVSESGGTVNFTVTSDKDIASTATVTFDFATGDVTATAGSDYTAKSGSGSISGGKTTTISVDILDDNVVEGNETFTLSLSNPSGNAAVAAAGSGGVGTETITDADTATLSINDVTVFEDAGTAEFTVTSSSEIGLSAVVTFSYATSDGSAITPGDYTAASGTGSISGGNTTTINVPIKLDTDVEPDETFLVTLSLPSAQVTSITKAVGTGTITNDEHYLTIVEKSPFGTITPVGDENYLKIISHGSSETFVIEATHPCPLGKTHNGKKHHISDVIVDGGAVAGAFGLETYTHTFSSITENHSIEALFTSYVDITVGANGHVETSSGNVLAGTSDSIEIKANASLAVKAVPAAGFYIADVKVNGSSVGYPETYTFEKVLDEDSTYEVTFSLSNFVLEPVSRFKTIFNEAGELTKATSRSVSYGTNSSFFVNLNDTAYAVYGILIDNITYPIPASGATVPYSSFTLVNNANDNLEVRFTNIKANHRLEVQDYDTSPISDVPLDAKLRPKPASIMFVLDDSGSMDWEVITSSADGLFRGDYYIYSYPNVNRARVYEDNSLVNHNEHDRWKSQWAGMNKMFYNPEVTYVPWPTFTGDITSQLPAPASDGLAHANIYRPRLHPWHSQDCSTALSAGELTSVAINGGALSSCNTTTNNEHNFPMDSVFLLYEDTTGTVVVDNTSANFSKTPYWESHTTSSDYGSDYLVPINSNNENDTATWSFTPAATGKYEVSAWWVASNNRHASGVPYTISCASCGGGGTSVTVNQRNNGGQWNVLGEFDFVAGETVTVTLRDTYNTNYTSCADAVRIRPKDRTISIINAHYYTWDDKDKDGVINFNDTNGNKQIDEGETVNEDIYLVNLTNPIQYFKVIDNTQSVSAANLTRVSAAALPLTVKTYASPLAADAWKKERQNWADWFSYYRKRTLAATGAVAQVIDRMEEVEVGIRSINYDGTYGISQAVLPVNVSGEKDRTNDLLAMLYKFQIQQKNTPLRSGLRAVGRYFDDNDSGLTGGIGTSPYAKKEDGDECKQTFAIVMTDGYWNTDSGFAIGTDGQVDKAEGAPYADNYANTLADVAMYYFKKDLSTMEDLVPDGIHKHQHMVTYSVAFGVYGMLNPTDYNFNKAIYPTWPDPATNERHKVDDLWHAAVNGRGKFMNASRPDELVKSLLDIMNDIGTRVGSGSSVSVNGDEMYESVNGQIRMFQTTYNSGNWHGDLKAYQIDTTTGEVMTSSPVWSAENKMATRLTPTGSGHVSRLIASYNGTAGIPFRWDTTKLTSRQQKQLLPYFSNSLTGEHVLNYLRGDKTKEVTQPSGELRARDNAHPLGDFIHSLARFEDDVLYVGGNDGMLHAFRASDTGGGEELFAYVPNLVFDNLRELADPAYTHKFYVDNTPDTQKIGTSTYLVGGLGKGGKGYYCLDITNAKTDITSEAELASRVKWEYPAPPTILLTGNTFTFSSGTGTGGDDRILDSLNKFTAANGFVAGKTIAVTGANFNDGTNSGTNDGHYKIKKVDAAGGYIEVTAGSLITGYGNGKSIIITESTKDTGLGYSYSKAFFVETNDKTIGLGGWVVIFGNGYGSEDGTASLYVLNPTNGAVLKKIDTKVGPLNGMSTPNAIDVNNDLRVDYVYAGDLLGNMWKFDFTSSDYTKWQVAYCDNASAANHCQDTVSGMVPQPLFAGLANQPITAAPDIMRHQSKQGYMVIFGTGKYLGEPDLSSKEVQSLYGIWDWAPDALNEGYNGARIDVGTVSPKTATLSNWPETSAGGKTHTLLRQVVWVEGTLTEDTNKNNNLDAGEDINGNDKLDTYSYYRIPSNYPGTWSTEKTTNLETGNRFYNKDINGDGKVDDKDKVPVAHVGWVFDLPGKIDLSGTRILGERVVNDAIIRDGRAILLSFGITGSRCNAGAYSFLNERNAQTGGMLNTPAFDLNGDGVVDASDYVSIQVPYDVNGDGSIDGKDIIPGIPGDLAGEGRMYNPAILRQDALDDKNPQEKKYFSTSQGAIIVVKEKAEKRGMSFWQQFE